MPTVDEILIGLERMANAWIPVAVSWHVYFAAAILALLFGVRPSRRVAGILLALPLLSVSVLAWASLNPFNGIVFAVLGILCIALSLRLSSDRVRLAPGPWVLPGGLLFVFGLVYPHFLDASSPLAYLYAAPTGVIPCPTLSVVVGMALLLDGLHSRAFSFTLVVAGLFYGATGVAQLGVALDWVLLLGTVLLFLRTIQRGVDRSAGGTAPG